MASTAKQTTVRKNSLISIRTIAGIGVLSAAAFVLQMLEFPIPLVPSFLKFDLSDLPALIGSYALGPISGILIELIKNLFHRRTVQFPSGSCLCRCGRCDL